MISKGLLPIGRYIPLTKREQMYRSLILGLQLKSGLDIGTFCNSYSENAFQVFGQLLVKLNDYGCLEQDEESIRLTKYGAYFVEDVCDFIIDAALKDESGDLVRASHSGGNRFSNATQ
jgi:coproporphyrinogen III oxidase-like Fe-S oxidoreductase